MNLNIEDKQLLDELCTLQDVKTDKVIKLLQTVSKYEFQDRRTGVYADLRDILKVRREDTL